MSRPPPRAAPSSVLPLIPSRIQRKRKDDKKETETLLTCPAAETSIAESKMERQLVAAESKSGKRMTEHLPPSFAASESSGASTDGKKPRYRSDLAPIVANMFLMLRDRGYRTVETREIDSLFVTEGEWMNRGIKKKQEDDGKEEEEKKKKRETSRPSSKSGRSVKKIFEPRVLGYAKDERMERCDMVCVLYDEPDMTFGREAMSKYGQWLMDNHLYHALFLVPSTITPMAANDASALKAEHEIECEFFSFSELAFSVVRHKLVPKHEWVPLEDRTRILNVLGASPNRLSRIRKSIDPIAKYYNWKIADLIRVINISSTFGMSVCYSIVSA